MKRTLILATALVLMLGSGVAQAKRDDGDDGRRKGRCTWLIDHETEVYRLRLLCR